MRSRPARSRLTGARSFVSGVAAVADVQPAGLLSADRGQFGSFVSGVATVAHAQPAGLQPG